MLQKFIESLCEDLQVFPIPQMNKNKGIEFSLNQEILLHFTELEPGISFHASIRSCPEKRKEELFILLMRANFLGQGTAGARIGLDKQEKFLTLSLGLPYELDYQTFKHHVEEFVNYLVYWRDQIEKFEQEKPLI